MLRPQCCVYILSEASLHGRNLYPKHLNVTCLHRNDRTSKRKKLPFPAGGRARGSSALQRPRPAERRAPAAPRLRSFAQCCHSEYLFNYYFFPHLLSVVIHRKMWVMLPVAGLLRKGKDLLGHPSVLDFCVLPRWFKAIKVPFSLLKPFKQRTFQKQYSLDINMFLGAASKTSSNSFFWI